MADNTISWETTKQWLVALTGDLKESSTVPDALLAARKAVAIAVTTGQIYYEDTFECRSIYSPSIIALAPSKWAPYEAARPTVTPTTGQMVVRRTSGLPFKALQPDNWPETKMYGLRPTITYGPFLDKLNRTVNIDTFRPSPLQEFTSPISGDAPLFYTTGQVTRVGLLKTILGRGTAWIRADLFTRFNSDESSRAPSDTFFGLSIESGTMVKPFHGPPNPILPWHLTLQLVEDNAATDIFSITSIKSCSITFTFANSIATGSLTTSSAANVNVLGSGYNLQQSQNAPSYSEGRINFAMVPDTSVFLPPAVQPSQLVAVAGSSKVDAISWSIPGKNFKNNVFYETVGSGGFKLSLDGDSALTLLGDDLRISLGACNVIVEPGSISMSGIARKMPLRSRLIRVSQNEIVFGKGTGGSSITCQNFKIPTFYYAATAGGVESLTLRMNMSFSLDRPKTVNNERVAFEALNGSNEPWSTITWVHEPGFTGITINVQATNSHSVWRSLGDAPAVFALKNLLLKADEPRDIDIAGIYKEGAIISGGLTMTSFLRYSFPFLPDPYVTNFELVPDAAIEKNGIGYLNFAQSWSEESTSEMDIDMMTKIATPARTMQRNKDNSVDDNELGLIYHGEHKYWEPAFSQKELQSGVMPDFGLGSFFHIPNGKPSSNRIFHPPTLMDISTKISQFGVTFGTGLSKEISPGTGGIPIRGTPDLHSSLPGLAGTFADVEEFAISGLMLQSAQSNVRIMTLPGVHWEGVLDDSSHATYQFPYSGPTTHIAIQDDDGSVPSVKLVPIAPREAIDDLVDSFASRDKVSVAARHSLPFGMVALAKMKNDPAFPPARVHKIEFKLGGEVDQRSKMKSPEFEPAHQLSFTPPGKPFIHFPRPPFEVIGPSASSDRSFSGMTTILKMGLGPNAQELIDPATNTFMSDMQNKVPLSRFDVSGYGASMFSDWKRVLGPQDVNENVITNVLINVFNGRTSRTVVELYSVMAPFAVAVVKTIEIRRLNSGIVLRHESEWQPSSDGFYFYKNNGIITHPGIIRGVTNVRNIIDMGMTSVDGVHLDLRKVQFDCDVQVEDGGHAQSVTGLHLDGCVLLTGRREDAPDNDISSPNAPAWYASILQHLDLGGYIDAVVQIGTSGQMKRLTSISIRPSLDPASNNPVAVVAAMGSPIFVGGGQWSFVRTQSNDGYKQPYPVDLGIGVPLVKLGSHDSPDLGLTLTPYVFRDPQDLLRDFPATAYNIIHGAATHRVIFTSPQIPFVQDAKKGFEAAEVWVADSFALGKSTTIFPNLEDCLPIVLPDLPSGAKQLLEIDPRGGYKFEPTRMLGNIEIPQLEFPATTRLSDLERTIKIDASAQTVAQIMQTGNTLKDGAQELSKDVLDARTTISVAINTFGNVSKMDITNLHMVTRNINTATGAVKDATRVIGRLSSDVQKVGGLLGADPDIHLPDLPGLPKVAGDVQHVFGSSLSQVQKAISFLDNLKFLPHFKVSMTNEWSMVMSTSMNKNELFERLESPGPRDVVEKIIEEFDFLISATLSLSAFLLKLHIGTTIKIPTGVGPIVALGTGAFDVALGTSGVEVKLDLGFGIGVDFSVGPFSASASYTQSQTILFNDQVFGLGITACMRAHVDLVIASADLYLEAKLLVVGGDCHPKQPEKTHADHGGTTIWAYASVRIALHVSIFLVCNIGVEEDAHWDSNLNGGACLLDDMSDLIH